MWVRRDINVQHHEHRRNLQSSSRHGGSSCTGIDRDPDSASQAVTPPKQPFALNTRKAVSAALSASSPSTGSAATCNLSSPTPPTEVVAALRCKKVCDELMSGTGHTPDLMAACAALLASSLAIAGSFTADSMVGDSVDSTAQASVSNSPASLGATVQTATPLPGASQAAKADAETGLLTAAHATEVDAASTTASLPGEEDEQGTQEASGVAGICDAQTPMAQHEAHICRLLASVHLGHARPAGATLTDAPPADVAPVEAPPAAGAPPPSGAPPPPGAQAAVQAALSQAAPLQAAAPQAATLQPTLPDNGSNIVIPGWYLYNPPPIAAGGFLAAWYIHRNRHRRPRGGVPSHHPE